MRIDLYLTSAPFAEANLENKTVVVIDVLRSSTSVCAALMAGAKGVIPTDSPGEAGEMRSKLGRDIAVLAGERDGTRIDDFELGNSPSEFTQEAVGDKFVVMTTTNGTGMFKKTHKAELVLSAALVNASKVAERISLAESDLVIACSGKQGNFSIEDTLCGGLLINLLASQNRNNHKLNDAASIALLLYQNNKDAIPEAIRNGEHGKFLEELGFQQDVLTATEIDSMPVLPVLKEGRLLRDGN